MEAAANLKVTNVSNCSADENVLHVRTGKRASFTFECFAAIVFSLNSLINLPNLPSERFRRNASKRIYSCTINILKESVVWKTGRARARKRLEQPDPVVACACAESGNNFLVHQLNITNKPYLTQVVSEGCSCYMLRLRGGQLVIIPLIPVAATRPCMVVHE